MITTGYTVRIIIPKTCSDKMSDEPSDIINVHLESHLPSTLLISACLLPVIHLQHALLILYMY